MGLVDRLREQFIDIVEWLDDSRDTIVWRFPRHDNEIKMGAKLVVRESQIAVFVAQGSVCDAFPPGTYTLETQNMPVLSDLKGWKYGFRSPFKAEVYFANTRLFTDMKWGTQNPVIVRDPEFGMVRLRAFGTFAARVVEPVALLRELVGTDPQFRTEEVQEYLRQMIVGRLGNALAAARIPVLDLAAHQDAIGASLAGTLTEQLAAVGIAIPTFIIENISLPPEVEQAVDRRTQMGIVGDLDRYTQFQAANAIGDAARNPGGGSEGIGLGMGMALGQRMVASFGPAPASGPSPASGAAPAPAPGPPPAPAAAPRGGPPPLPQQDEWYLGVSGQQLGPFHIGDLRAQLSAGVLTPETLVWRNGMAQWVPARDLPELASLFGGPPPLPSF